MEREPCGHTPDEHAAMARDMAGNAEGNHLTGAALSVTVESPVDLPGDGFLVAMTALVDSFRALAVQNGWSVTAGMVMAPELDDPLVRVYGEERPEPEPPTGFYL